MAEFAATLPVETLQPPYHLFRRDIEDRCCPTAGSTASVCGIRPVGPRLAHRNDDENTTFASEDWRASSAMFTGDGYRHNLAAVRALDKFAADRGVSVSQLAIAWTLANPAVHVAIVGARRAEHVPGQPGRRGPHAEHDDLAEIDNVMAAAAPVGGPSPESG